MEVRDQPNTTESAKPLTLGDLIAQKRTIKGWNQAKFGELLGVSGGAVGNWERGGRIAEDNWPAIKELLEIDQDNLTDEMLAQIGRKSRRPIKMTSREVFEVLSQGPLKNANITRTTEFDRPDSFGRVVEATIALEAKRMPKEENDRILARQKTMYDRIAKHLPIELAENLGTKLLMNGHQYRFDYYSEKMVMMFDAIAFRAEAEDQDVRPSIIAGVSPAALWKLAVTKNTLSDARDYIYVAKATPQLLNSPHLQRRMAECAAMGLGIMLVTDLFSLAEAIKTKEEGQTESANGDVEDDFDVVPD